MDILNQKCRRRDCTNDINGNCVFNLCNKHCQSSLRPLLPADVPPDHHIDSNTDIDLLKGYLPKHGAEWFARIESSIKKPLYSGALKIEQWENFLNEPLKVEELNLAGYPFTELPPTVFKLTNLKDFNFYGSDITFLPPQVKNLTQLTTFTPYTSYDLHFFPFEILKCTKINNFTVSTRALYGNYKNDLQFPRLDTFNPNTIIPEKNYSYNPDEREGCEDTPPCAINWPPSLKSLLLSQLQDEELKKINISELDDLVANANRCSLCDSVYIDSYIRCWVEGGIGHQKVPLLANLCSWMCVGMLYASADRFSHKPIRRSLAGKYAPPEEPVEVPKDKPSHCII